MMRREMEARRLARHTDPHTSHEAAAKVDTFKASHDAAIYAALDGKPDGLTYREIAAIAKLEPVQVGRRLSYLRGLVTRRRDEVTGEYRARDGMALWWRV